MAFLLQTAAGARVDVVMEITEINRRRLAQVDVETRPQRH
jgi:hypothetical protein